jgi:hypothetical protein
METFLSNIDLVKLLMTVVAFFLVRTLNKVDKNQALLFGRLETLEGKLNRLYGAHEVNHHRRNGDD